MAPRPRSHMLTHPQGGRQAEGDTRMLDVPQACKMPNGPHGATDTKTHSGVIG